MGGEIAPRAGEPAVTAVKRAPKPAPAVGEVWFVKLPKAEQLACVLIDELTPMTVVLRLERDSNVSYSGPLGRYVRHEVRFVERVAE